MPHFDDPNRYRIVSNAATHPIGYRPKSSQAIDYALRHGGDYVVDRATERRIWSRCCGRLDTR